MPERGCCLLLSAVLVVLICGAGCCAVDAPAARVNDHIIMRSELDRFISLMELCNPEAASPGKGCPPGCREQEFLHLLIGFELVNQAAEKAGVSACPEMVESGIEEMLQELVKSRYGGSPDKLHRRRKKLGLTLNDLGILPRYELEAGALLERLAPVVDEADLFELIEKNSEMLVQPAAGELYRFRFAGEVEAEKCLAALQRGVKAEEFAADKDLDCTNRGWIAEDDPFLEKRVRQELFTRLEKEKGFIITSSEQYFLYWVQGIRPTRQLEFSEIRDEAARLKKCLLYEQFYYDLWNEGDIEIYLRRP